MILQLLISESQLGLRVNRLLRERSVQQRTLAMILDDVQRSSRISPTPQLEQHACSLAGRLPVLHLTTTTGPITYSVGAAPSAIWRGQVLMRCGPAFDLAGQPTLGSAAQNRVVIDGLATHPEPWQGCGAGLETSSPPQDLAHSSGKALSGCLEGSANTAVLGVRVVQELAGARGEVQRIDSETRISSAV
ncbi:MAG: hypothetical protein ACKO5F_16240 [Synechococcus sp.]